MAQTDFLPPEPAVEQSVNRWGNDLFDRMAAQSGPGLLSKKGVYARLMEWSMKDPAFKAQLFRFVDVLPTLQSSSEIVRHLREYLGDRAVELNPAMKMGLAASSFAPALVAGPVKANVVAMAAQFVAGETPEDLIKRIRANRKAGVATTIDLLGETVVSQAEAEIFLRRNLEVLEVVAKFYREEGEPIFSDLGPSGPLPQLNLSVKVSALTPDVHPADPAPSVIALKERLRPILRQAAALGAFINFDMESYKLKDLTFALFRSILEEPEFAAKPEVGIAVQAYLRDAEQDLSDLIAWARRRSRAITVRLVKGAYWDSETILARQRDWPVPVWSQKPQSDANYEKLTVLLLQNVDLVTPAFATHNVRSCAHAIARAEKLGVDPRAYEFQALYGMADELKMALVGAGRRVREYCPVGELLPGMAYLVRRLLENTSNEGFLRAANGATAREVLLRNPVVECVVPNALSSPTSGQSQRVGDNALHLFTNAANTDFTQASARENMRRALDEAPKRFGKTWPLVIGGKKLSDRDLIASVNPARPAQIVGRWPRATIADADAAVAAAQKAQPEWAQTAVAERASILERVAELMEERRFALNALEVFEAGKPWIEADGDISEAVDFCRYYAKEMRLLSPEDGIVTQAVPGERCVQRWTARGVGVAIAPWNFPLAILTGMTVAPLVAGNAVIIKPAEQTVGIGAALMDLLTEAGVPPGVAQFVPGFGEDVGARLVAHPGIDFVAFTGSRPVGLAIWETAGKTAPGQRNLKKVVCEMGGKNALIIDDDADLDEAIPAILYSAFGFSGQKCSALSRLIVLEAVHDKLVERLVAAAEAMPVGDPAKPGTMVGPVIDGDAQKKILGLIERGKKEAKLAWQGAVPPSAAADAGYYVAPTIFVGVKPEHVIAKEEIFGPVLAVMKAGDLDEAFALANQSEYALTGGLFSRSPSALARAEREMEVGNLYLNRGITGAIVERHPFGGYKMSGGGSKAGGKGYLENFLFPRAVVENVLRRGFTPDRV